MRNMFKGLLAALIVVGLGAQAATVHAADPDVKEFEQLLEKMMQGKRKAAKRPAIKRPAKSKPSSSDLKELHKLLEEFGGLGLENMMPSKTKRSTGSDDEFKKMLEALTKRKGKSPATRKPAVPKTKRSTGSDDDFKKMLEALMKRKGKSPATRQRKPVVPAQRKAPTEKEIKELNLLLELIITGERPGGDKPGARKPPAGFKGKHPLDKMFEKLLLEELRNPKTEAEYQKEEEADEKEIEALLRDLKKEELEHKKLMKEAAEEIKELQRKIDEEDEDDDEEDDDDEEKAIRKLLEKLLRSK